MSISDIDKTGDIASNAISVAEGAKLSYNYFGIGLSLIATLVILISTILLYRKHNNLGTKLMLLGFVGAALTELYFASVFYNFSSSRTNQIIGWLFWETPYLGGAFSLLASIGFLIFVLTLKNEN